MYLFYNAINYIIHLFPVIIVSLLFYIYLENRKFRLAFKILHTLLIHLLVDLIFFV